jgi:hypothetical protein
MTSPISGVPSTIPARQLFGARLMLLAMLLLTALFWAEVIHLILTV